MKTKVRNNNQEPQLVASTIIKRTKVDLKIYDVDLEKKIFS